MGRSWARCECARSSKLLDELGDALEDGEEVFVIAGVERDVEVPAAVSGVVADQGVVSLGQ
jgi:hypothetical protein